MFEEFEIPASALPWVHLLWTAPFVVLLTFWGVARRRQTLAVFGFDAERSRDWLVSLGRRRRRRALILAAALVALTAAALEPRCDPERTTYKTSARDIAVLLDVSRSMLADDLKPNRLERAKLELSDLADRLAGDRIGLIVFAGDAVIKCPLTSNYSYFKTVLRTITTNSVPQPGTHIGDAVRKALTDLLGVDRGEDLPDEKARVGETLVERELREFQNFADILLITDGEDHDSYPVKAAELAAAFDIGIYAVGLGDEKGTPIPVRGEDGTVELLRSREGEVVRSRLDSRTLQDMVNTTPRGQYLPAGTYNFDLVSFFDETIAREEGRETYEEQVFWTEIYQPFLFLGLALYLLYLVLSERPAVGQLALQEEARKEPAPAAPA
jgi:Ca-activated chloride channel family protein